MRAGFRCRCTEGAFESAAFPNRAGARHEMRPLRALACGVGGEHRGHAHVGAQRRGQLSPSRHRGLGGAERLVPLEVFSLIDYDEST